MNDPLTSADDDFGWLHWAVPSPAVFVMAFVCCAAVTLLIVAGVELSFFAVVAGYAVPIGAYALMVLVQLAASLGAKLGFVGGHAHAR